MSDDLRHIETAVRTRLMDLAYRRMLQSVGISLTVPLIFVWLVQPVFGRAAAVWLAIVAVASLLRGALWYAWSRLGMDGDNLPRWTLLFWGGATIGAVGWSDGAAALLLDAAPREAMLIAIMMMGVTAIASSALAPHLLSSLTFIVVVLAPVAIEMLAKADPVVRVAGLAVIVGIVALAATVFRAHRELANLFRAELRLSTAVVDAVHARAAAEEASVAKSAFLANMSHELRTPLNAILGYSEMLWEDAAGAGNAPLATDLQRVTTAGRHLLALINDVLDLSKIEAGRMDITRERVDVAAVVRRVAETSTTLAATGGNQLVVDAIDGLGLVETDEVKLQQVLLNLVGNACKFTSQGRVEITGRRATSGGSEWIEIDVRDSGIGMTPEQMQRLFLPFTQADNSATRKYGGTGLGLAISQRLCRLMGGEILAQSRFGSGSTFTVRLPATPRVGDRAVAEDTGSERSAA